ncbi:hypothetical protein BLNAU_3261 [Blattamonas nauphoetae]|uniref:Uncharacterized protein n=1 Tax=Blattamonas nauphoetae TaxID=2049346 RepID=A0ABQ9YDM2_9EUKA|nr:hypothetical protein BLNAU_3261 [Blattamonas nauphoetae]
MIPTKGGKLKSVSVPCPVPFRMNPLNLIRSTEMSRVVKNASLGILNRGGSCVGHFVTEVVIELFWQVQRGAGGFDATKRDAGRVVRALPQEEMRSHSKTQFPSTTRFGSIALPYAYIAGHYVENV